LIDFFSSVKFLPTAKSISAMYNSFVSKNYLLSIVARLKLLNTFLSLFAKVISLSAKSNKGV